MKSGQVPIHIMRWAPSDFVNDPFVKLLIAREDFATLSLYVLVLNWSHIEGGDLSSDTEQLAAVLGFRPKVVAKALKVCTDAGKIVVENGRLYNPRVSAEVLRELEFRANQATLGKKGGRPTLERIAKGKPKASLLESEKGNQSPPSPSPSPSPAPYASAERRAPEPKASPPTDPPDEAAVLRAECRRLLAEEEAITHLGQDRLLAKASRTPNGQMLVSVENCASVPWLTVTRDRLIGMRLARDAEAPAPITEKQESPIAAWLRKDGRTLPQLAEAFLDWVAEKGRESEREGDLTEKWRQEIGAPPGLVISAAVYHARKQRAAREAQV